MRRILGQKATIVKADGRSVQQTNGAELTADPEKRLPARDNTASASEI